MICPEMYVYATPEQFERLQVLHTQQPKPVKEIAALLAECNEQNGGTWNFEVSANGMRTQVYIKGADGEIAGHTTVHEDYDGMH